MDAFQEWQKAKGYPVTDTVQTEGGSVEVVQPDPETPVEYCYIEGVGFVCLGCGESWGGNDVVYCGTDSIGNIGTSVCDNCKESLL